MEDDNDNVLIDRATANTDCIENISSAETQNDSTASVDDASQSNCTPLDTTNIPVTLVSEGEEVLGLIGASPDLLCGEVHEVLIGVVDTVSAQLHQTAQQLDAYPPAHITTTPAVAVTDVIDTSVGAAADECTVTDTCLSDAAIRNCPENYKCPISLDIMRDPVICSSGYTYERANIEEWLKHRDIDPETGLVLANKTLVPNRALKYMIEEFCHAHAEHDFVTFMHYVQTGEVKQVSRGLAAHPDFIERRDMSGNTALHVACMHGRVDTALALISAGANLHRTNFYNDTPFMAACVNNHPLVMDALFAEDPSVNNVYRQDGVTPLMRVAELGLVAATTKLLSYGGDINIKNKKLHTALMIACTHNNLDVVEELLRGGADPLVTDKNGRTADELTQDPAIKHVFSASKTSGGDEPEANSPMPSVLQVFSNIIPLSALDIQQCAASKIKRGTFRRSHVVIKKLRGRDGNHCITFRDVVMNNQLKILTRFNHHRLVRYYGLSCETIPMWGLSFNLILECMSRGSLYGVLHSPDTPEAHLLTSKSSKLRVLVDVVEGLKFLHDNFIVHGSLSSHCILMDADGRAKLSDFGASIVLENAEEEVSINMNNRATAWMSPEAVTNDGFVSLVCDIYSYGVIAFEVLTGNEPYSGLSAQEIAKKVSYGSKLRFAAGDKGFSEELAELINSCLASPLQRPLLSVLHEDLNLLVRKSEKEELMACLPSMCCPITQEILIDPVVCSDGHTYERNTLVTWFKHGKCTSPLTNKQIECTLTPNHTLRKLISEADKL